MKKLIIALAIAALPLQALAAPIDSAVGNTIVVRNADGSTLQVRLKADGTETQTLPDGSVVHGTWTVANGQLCQTLQGAQPMCVPVAEGKNVGDSWTSTDAQGHTATISILAGQ